MVSNYLSSWAALEEEELSWVTHKILLTINLCTQDPNIGQFSRNWPTFSTRVQLSVRQKPVLRIGMLENQQLKLRWQPVAASSNQFVFGVGLLYSLHFSWNIWGWFWTPPKQSFSFQKSKFSQCPRSRLRSKRHPKITCSMKVLGLMVATSEAVLFTLFHLRLL